MCLWLGGPDAVNCFLFVYYLETMFDLTYSRYPIRVLKSNFFFMQSNNYPFEIVLSTKFDFNGIFTFNYNEFLNRVCHSATNLYSFLVCAMDFGYCVLKKSFFQDLLLGLLWCATSSGWCIMKLLSVRQVMGACTGKMVEVGIARGPAGKYGKWNWNFHCCSCPCRWWWC